MMTSKTEPKQLEEISLSSLKDLKMLAFDFDGVFTDNHVYIDQNGIESVKCSREDGIGLNLVRELGIKTIIISSETNKVVSKRADKLKIECFQSISDKGKTLLSLCEERKIKAKDVAFLGNDINDISAFKVAGLALGVNDSNKSILEFVDFLTNKRGGKGAVRELCDLVYLAKGGQNG